MYSDDEFNVFSSSVLYTPVTLYWAKDKVLTVIAGSIVAVLSISSSTITKVTSTVLPIVPAVPVSELLTDDILLKFELLETWLAEITYPELGVIVNTAVFPDPIVLVPEAENVILPLIVKLLNVIDGVTVKILFTAPESLTEAGIPKPCTDNSFVSILDKDVSSPNILLNLKFSFSLKNLTLPVCWSVEIESAYQPFVGVSVNSNIWFGI